MVFAPEPYKLPWWKKLKLRIHFFLHPIRFDGVYIPIVNSVMMPRIQLNELAKVQPLDRSLAKIFYLDLPRFAVRRRKSFWEFW